MKIKNNKVFLNTKKHRNNTNFTYKSSQKEHHINISRNYYTINNKNIYSSKLKVTKSDIDKINKLVIIKRNRHIKNNKTNKDHKYNLKVQNNVISNIYLKIWKMTFYNETENPWQECQPYRTEKWPNHQITKRRIKLHTNNNPIKIIKSVDTEHIIKIKYLKVTYRNRNMPASFHHILFLFFTHGYKLKQIPASWKISLTILLYKKGDPSLLSNHRPIALANTIDKLFTSTLTLILSAYGKRHQILHDNQEGFRAQRCTSRQLQLLIKALEDAQFTTQDIYLLYIDFKNASGSIDHA